MGVFGFLALATQLDHILLGPQQIMRGQGISADRKSLWIQSDRTVFAWPFRRDRISYGDKTRTRTMLSPVGLMHEPPIVVGPLAGRTDRNITRFNGSEIYPIDAQGRVLMKIGSTVMGLRVERRSGKQTVIAGREVQSGKILRNSDGTLRGSLEESDGIPIGMLWEKGRMRDRIKAFIHHPVCVINPRFLLILIASGAFDTSWYFIGKDVGRRQAEYHAGLGLEPKNTSEKRILATTLLPIPLASPTSPKHLLEQTAVDIGLRNSSSADDASQQFLAQTLPLPGSLSQFVAGINANSLQLQNATHS